MTTTINASTSTGLISTADTSGIIKLQSNGVTTNALAWFKASWNGTTMSVASSYNISSLTRNSAGSYTITMSNALADTNYAVIGTLTQSSSYSGTLWFLNDVRVAATTTTVFGISTYNTSFGSADPAFINVAVFGN